MPHMIHQGYVISLLEMLPGILEFYLAKKLEHTWLFFKAVGTLYYTFFACHFMLLQYLFSFI